MKPVSEIRAWEQVVDNGCRIEVVEIPVGTPYQATRWDYDDREIMVPKSSGSLWMRVCRENSVELVATATFAADKFVARCNSVFVTPGFRRAGLATYLYYLASERFDARIVPSNLLLKDGATFWSNRSAIDFRDLPA